MENYKKLPVSDIFFRAFEAFTQNFWVMMLFSALNFVSILLGIETWRTPKFFLVLLVAYIMWSYFFRYCFKKEPYLDFKAMFSSVAPSTKILFLMFVVMTALILLPFALPFLGIGDAEYYMRFLNDKETLDMVLSVISLFIAPYILFRPFFVWIASVLGNNKSLKFAFYHTRGNYWSIVCLLLILNLPCILVEQIFQYFVWPSWGLYALLSPIVVYGNLIMVESYKFFFLEK